MADEPDSIVRRYLRRRDEKLDQLRDNTREVKTRLTLLEQQHASISNRVDRIERRLELVETPYHSAELQRPTIPSA